MKSIQPSTMPVEFLMFENSEINDVYLYTLRQFLPENERNKNGISELDVVNAHFALSDYFISKGESVRYGVLNYNMLSSAVNRQFIEFCGVKKWSDDFHLMATLLYGLTMNHAFQDGNKRTALLSILLYINRLSRVINVPADYFETLVVRIASNSLYFYPDYKRYLNTDDPEVNFVADKLRNWTRKTDKRIYTVTFSEFNSKLKKYGVELREPAGNSIGVYRKEKNRLPFWGKESWKRICNIGFPGWKKQVSELDIRTVLKSAGLTLTRGIDSTVFFNNAAPTYELLSYYHKPLLRLKDE